ncbi:MAG: hypothetical protein ACE5WD_14650 [Candidatus Aminicenantia bacterium]
MKELKIEKIKFNPDILTHPDGPDFISTEYYPQFEFEKITIWKSSQDENHYVLEMKKGEENFCFGVSSLKDKKIIRRLSGEGIPIQKIDIEKSITFDEGRIESYYIDDREYIKIKLKNKVKWIVASRVSDNDQNLLIFEINIQKFIDIF